MYKNQCTYLKKAEPKDIGILFEWTNEDETRKNSITHEKVEYSEHEKWFEQKMNSLKSEIYIYLVGNTPIGQIRFDYVKDKANISFSIDKKYRGQGHGKNILNLAEKELLRNRPSVRCLIAVVKANNIASRKIFTELSYFIEDASNCTNYVNFTKNILTDNTTKD